jgi:hypothetical protein
MNEYGAIEYVNERLSEHESRVHMLAQAREVRGAEPKDQGEVCGPWCQVKRRAPAFRLHPFAR